MLRRGDIGRVHFGTSTRVNLGIHQSDASVVRDLGPHDFSILHYWFGEPSFVRAIGRASVTDKLDVAFIDLGFPDQSLVPSRDRMAVTLQAAPDGARGLARR